VWDLDETLIIFNSLVTQQFPAAHPSCPPAEAFALGEQWQDAILDLADDRFFNREVIHPSPPPTFFFLPLPSSSSLSHLLKQSLVELSRLMCGWGPHYHVASEPRPTCHPGSAGGLPADPHLGAVTA